LPNNLSLIIEVADNELSHVMRNLLQTLYCYFIDIRRKVDDVTEEITYSWY